VLPEFWRRASSRRKRIISVAVFLLLWQIVTVAGLFSPLSQQDANSINQDLNQVRADATVENIFGHNLMVCLVMFIPVAGPIVGFYSSYGSGLTMVAMTMSPEGKGLPPVLVYFAYILIPVYWLEMISMSIGLAESVWLIRRAAQGLGKREVKNAAVLIAIVTVILLVSAIIEIALINVLNR
jgi:hypothetical protein